jgi:hypothetical protein
MTIRGGMTLAACLTACLAIPVRAGERADAILRPERTKRIVLVFVRAVGREDLLKAWDESFAGLLGLR